MSRRSNIKRSRRATGPSRATVDLIWYRDNSRCLRCGVGLYPGAEHSIHHRIPRGMGGTRSAAINHPTNLMLLCGSGVTGCHGWVESNRDAARNIGFLVRVDDDPETIPFQDAAGDWWLLDDNARLRLGVWEVSDAND